MTMIVNPTFEHRKKSVIKYENTSEYLAYRKEWDERPKTHDAGSFPTHLDLEATNVCNLRCKMCFQSFAPELLKPFGFMDFNLYKKIIDEGVKKGLKSIKLQYRGEALLHPKFVDMVKYARDNGVVDVMVNTNATLLTEDMSRKLIKVGLTKLICSVDGCDAETYEAIRIGAKFKNVLENIKIMQRLKKMMNSELPVVRVQMVDTPWNHDQMDAYIKYWSAIVEDVGTERMNDWHPDRKIEIVVSKDFECPLIYQRLIVTWDGRVSICCGNTYVKLVAGDLNKQTVEEVWNGSVMKMLRENSEAGTTHQIPICNECGFRKTIIGILNEKKAV